MYNNGQYNNSQESYKSSDYDNKNYYRNDVPTGGAAENYGGSGSIEDMLFYSKPDYGTPAQAAGARQAEQRPHSATMYAEPEQAEANAYARQDAYADRFDEDAYPSVTTMQFREREGNPYEDYREQSDPLYNKRYKVTAKGKIIVAVYAIVVATILLLIVLNTRLLKNVNSQIAQQQSKIVALQEQNDLLNDRLEYVKSDEVIAEKAAEELGMVHD